MLIKKIPNRCDSLTDIKSPLIDEAGTHDGSITLKHGRGFHLFFSVGFVFMYQIQSIYQRNKWHIGMSQSYFKDWKHIEKTNHLPPTVFKNKIERKLRDFCCWGEWTHEMRSGRGPLSARKGRGGRKKTGKMYYYYSFFVLFLLHRFLYFLL
jgi:hypothetical protein